MPNMTMTKTPMPEQKPDVRNHNFEEVALGYTEEMAVGEAQRCLNSVSYTHLRRFFLRFKQYIKMPGGGFPILF